MLGTLAEKRAIWATFIAALAMTAVFVWLQQRYGMELIDGISEPDEVGARIASFSAQQRSVHIWVTATLDVAYPLAYGSFFAGLALRAFGGAGKWAALPALAVIAADLTEGVVQILLLSGNDRLLGLKAVLTPLKFALFWAALAIGIAALVMLAWRKFSKA